MRKKAGVTLDRTTDKHRGTGIMMIHLREFKPRETAASTKEILKGWIVDYDKEGKPIQIEVMNPAAYLPKTILDLLPPEFPEFPE